VCDGFPTGLQKGGKGGYLVLKRQTKVSLFFVFSKKEKFSWSRKEGSEY
jgi:hypothetical protein